MHSPACSLQCAFKMGCLYKTTLSRRVKGDLNNLTSRLGRTDYVADVKGNYIFARAQKGVIVLGNFLFTRHLCEADAFKTKTKVHVMRFLYEYVIKIRIQN